MIESTAFENEIFCGSSAKSFLVLDLGTTNLAAALIDTQSGRILRELSAPNPQRLFGADVISRISYCQKNGSEKLTRLVRHEISRILAELGGADTLHVAGNTTMLHLLLGVDPTPMGTYPYTPAFLDEKLLNAASLGIGGVEKIHLLPSISAFVGADIVAGICHVGQPTEGKWRLLVDLGTNAEAVLISRNKILAASAAAGPCFEGACISCGMSATDGAIYAYGKDGARVLGDTEVLGICGTGLVDAVAHLLDCGIIDDGGYMECERYEIAHGVFLTQSDVREFQLAKSAVMAAILTLIGKADIGFEDIEGLYVSGGFSTKINPFSASRVGLLPQELCGRCIALGNSSLQGTAKSLLCGTRLSDITKAAEYIDLSAESEFEGLFISGMKFENKKDL